MATHLKNLSDYDSDKLPCCENLRFGIVVSEWNEEITLSLLKGAYESLTENGVKEDNILVKYVPGSFELTFASKQMAQNNHVDAVIALGCVVKGDTPHFDYVCSGVTQGIAFLNATGNVPVIFGVLTTDNQQQALDRAGGIHGNKGTEAAITAIKMTTFSCE